MTIKYAEGIDPTLTETGKVVSNEIAKRQGSTYSGASWNKQLGPDFIGKEMTTRARLRAAGQTKGKQNPLLGACRSHSGPTGHLTAPVGASIHSSKPGNRKVMRKLKAQWEKQQSEEELNGLVKNVEPE